jgi:hypothetical protein
MDYPSDGYLALWFNLDREPWSDVAVRREVARRLNREAIAWMVCRSEGCAPEPWGPPRAAADVVVMPETATLLAIEDEHRELVEAIVYHFKDSLRVELDVVFVPIDQFLVHLDRRDIDMVLVPLPELDAGAYIGSKLDLLTGYRDPDLARAYRQSPPDVAAIKRILHRDVPVLPLALNRQIAVIPGDWCGQAPQRLSSWRWIATLRPCAEGER